MGFELTKSKRIICMFLIFIVATYLSAYDSRAGSYPFLEEAKWVCNDPGFTLTYSRASNGTMDATEILEWNNDTIEVDLEFRSSFFVQVLKTQQIMMNVFSQEPGNIEMEI